ncbi:MAG TPA: TIR-like protein FxsC [Streptosporangiaceae bacterium]
MPAECPYFFLSYARTHFGSDPDKWTVKFYHDLCADISQLTGSESPGYMDQQRLMIGAEWPSDLTQALATCRVFMPIYSPQYFNSEYCGKEWTIFNRRVERHARGGPSPRVIIPAMWTAMELTDLPEFARFVQYHQADLPAHYLRQGLYGIMKLGRYREAYKETVLCLARAIVAAAETQLTPLDEAERTRLDLVPNAFADVKRPASSLDVRLTVAACDLNSLPADRDRFYYGLKPLGWSPYRSRDEKPVADIAEAIVRGMGHRAKLKELGAGPEETALPDVMLVDMWAADDTRLAGDLKRSNGSTMVVLLPVDQEDAESAQHTERLEAAVDSLIGTALAKQGSRRRVHYDQFRDSLIYAVNTAISHYLKTARVENAPAAQPKPSLHGFEPGGRTH